MNLLCMSVSFFLFSKMVVSRPTNNDDTLLTYAKYLHIDVSKSDFTTPQSNGVNWGKCPFDIHNEKDASRIPQHINYAVLKDTADPARCKPLKFDIKVLKTCNKCTKKDVYMISTETKVVGYVEE